MNADTPTPQQVVKDLDSFAQGFVAGGVSVVLFAIGLLWALKEKL